MSRQELIVFLLRYWDGVDMEQLNSLSTEELRLTFIRLKSAKIKLINDRTRMLTRH